MNTFGGMSFEEAKKKFAKSQDRWDSLTPEEQKAESKAYAAYDDRVLSEAGYFDDEQDDDEY